jgi:hypothetical protein
MSDLSSITVCIQIIATIVMNLVIPKDSAQQELLFNKMALGLRKKLSSLAADFGIIKFEWFVQIYVRLK